MRKLKRPPLPEEVQERLNTWQAEVDLHSNSKRRERWKNRKKTDTIKAVRARLIEMSGSIERCMYCETTAELSLIHI